MLMAAPSWRAATKEAPPATSALVTSKLPLPISPETCRTPSRARVAPTAWATRTVRLPRHQGQGPRRAARSSDDGEWCHDEDRAGRGQLAEAHQGGQPVLPGAVHEVVAREGWVEAARHPRVGADGLHPEADDGRLLGQPAGAVRR